MKKAFIFLSFLFFVSFSYSQTIKIGVPLGAKVEHTEIIDGVTVHSYSAKSSIPINGIPYFKEYFQAGVLELHDGKKSAEVMLRYNIAKDVFEILRENDTLTLNRPFAVKYIYMDDRVYIFDPKLREDAERKLNGYFELRVDGKLTLFIKRLKDLSFHSFATNYQGGSGTKEYYYIDKVGYVGKTTEGKAFLLNSTRSLLNNLDDHKAEVKSFIKEHRIKFKNEADIVKVVKYYNSL